MRKNEFLLLIILGLSIGLPHAAEAQPNELESVAQQSAKGLELFKKQVRTILIHKCLKCHGGQSTKADFNLATRKALFESGYVEKTAKDSHLVKLITHAEEPHMPFKAPKLDAKSIKHIAEWIDLGAPYDKPLTESSVDSKKPMVVTDEDREFWSFQPLRFETPQRTRDDEWSRTEIDLFIRAAQDKRHLTPNPIADRRVLIRRAYFDLLGLPPTPEQVDEFVNDPSPDAYSQLLDRLLDSKHYGERWARHWMDVARFAESHGYEQDYDRPHAYHYRDFLIKAFNQDLPYDQFVKWQLAGDEFAPEDPLALMATGFLGAGVFPTQLTEAEFESARYDELDDMVTTTGVAFLGLSVGCARCHDHKFDPIPTRDYYAMAATFTRTIRSEIDIETNSDENRKKKRQWVRELATQQAALDDYDREQLNQSFRAWLPTFKADSKTGVWSPMSLKAVVSSAKTKFSVSGDTALATSPAPAKEVIKVTGEVSTKSIAGIRLETLTHDSFPRRGPGRAGNGNFALGDIRVELRTSDKRVTAVKLVRARATHQQNSGALSVAASIDGDTISGWAVDLGGIGKDQAAVFDFEKPVQLDGPAELIITMTFNHPNTKHTIGHFRLSTTAQQDAKPEVGQQGLSADLLNAILEAKKTGDPSSKPWLQAREYFKSIDSKRQVITGRLAAVMANEPKLSKVKVMVSSEGFPHMKHHADGRGYPHFYQQTYFLNRGDVNQKQEVVQPGLLQVISPKTAKLSDWAINRPDKWTRTTFNRATLANWITDPNDGAGQLAARVIVNRLWQHHFGRGLVATPNDFGFQGERPSHPQLLDWLADRLIKNGWKLKQVHKLIMSSAVYMQDGSHDAVRANIDRDNLLLWRRTPKRLEAEAIRDSMLKVSGQLDETMYGKGTLDQNMKRRSIYFFIKRSKLIPMLMLFDWPEHLVSIGQRQTTTIAPQALMFMNSPQGRAYAKSFASQIQSKLPAEQIGEAYRLAFGRHPNATEQQLGAEFLTRQEAHYVEQNKADSQQRALTDFCQLVFGMNEFVYVD